MTRTLYYASGSPFAWRVQLVLEHKGLSYDAKLLEFSKGDTQAPDFLKLNPRGKIPVLVDGDIVIRESVAIMLYLEKAYPENPVFGTTAAETGRIHERLLDMQHNVGTYFQQFAIPVFRGMADDKKTEMEEALSKLPGEVALINDWLGEAEYIAGNSVSAADFATYPVLALMQRVLSSPMVAAFDVSAIVPFSEVVPNIAAWMKRIEALPYFDATYPPHWKAAA